MAATTAALVNGYKTCTYPRPPTMTVSKEQWDVMSVLMPEAYKPATLADPSASVGRCPPSPGPLSFRRPETLPNKTTTLSRHGSHHYTQPSNHAAPVTTWLPLPIPTSQLTPPTHPLLDDPHCPKPTLHEQTPYLRPPPARRLPTTACTHYEPRPISPQNGNWSPKHDDDDDYYPRGRRPREDE